MRLRHWGQDEEADSPLDKDPGASGMLGTFASGALVQERRKNFFSEVEHILDGVLASYV